MTIMHLIWELIIHLKGKINNIQESNKWKNISRKIKLKMSDEEVKWNKYIELIDYELDIDSMVLKSDERTCIESIYNEDPLAFIDTIEIDFLDWSAKILKKISKTKNIWWSWDVDIKDDGWNSMSNKIVNYNIYKNETNRIIDLTKKSIDIKKINLKITDIFWFELLYKI